MFTSKTSEQRAGILHKYDILDWEPSPIVKIAKTQDNKNIAIVSENGRTEIWNTQFLSMIKVIPGAEDVMTSSAFWIHDKILGQRFFITNLNGIITEWDLKAKPIPHDQNTNNEGIWAASLSPTTDTDGHRFAIACENGCIEILKAIYGERAFLPCCVLSGDVKRALCVNWNKDGTKLASGSSNGFLKIWSVKIPAPASEGKIHGNEILQIQVDLHHHKNNKKRKAGLKNVPVCSVCFSPDDLDIICGSSDGTVNFWNAEKGFSTGSMKNHQADVNVLEIIVSENDYYCLATGVDPTIVIYSKPLTGTRNWEFKEKFSFENYDITSLLSFGNLNFKGLINMYVMIGCRDGLCYYRKASSIEENITRMIKKSSIKCLNSTPENPLISYRPIENINHKLNHIIVSAFKNKINIWNLIPDLTISENNKHILKSLKLENRSSLLMKIIATPKEHVISIDLIPNGRYIAFSTLELGTKIVEVIGLENDFDTDYLLSTTSTEEISSVKIEKFEPDLKLDSAHILKFTNDSKYLLCGYYNHSIDIVDIDGRLVLHKIKLPLQLEINFRYKQLIYNDINAIAYSTEKNLLIVTKPFSLHGFKLLNHDGKIEIKELYTQYCEKSPIQDIILIKNDSYLFLTRYRNITSLLDAFSGNFQHKYDFPYFNFTFDFHETTKKMLTKNGKIICIYNSQFFHIFDEDKKFGREKNLDDKTLMDKYFKDYKLLFACPMSDNNILMIWKNWKKVLGELPPPLYRHKFGS